MSTPPKPKGARPPPPPHIEKDRGAPQAPAAASASRRPPAPPAEAFDDLEIAEELSVEPDALDTFELPDMYDALPRLDADSLDAGVLPDEGGIFSFGEMPKVETEKLTREAELSRRQLPLGEMLLQASVIKEDQLEMALSEQRRTRNLLGEVLVSLGFATDTVIAETVSRQTGIPFIHVPREALPGTMLKLIPEETARKFRLLGVRTEGNVLHLAMANPFDVVALDHLRDTTGMTPLPSIAPWSEILAAIERNFSKKESFDESFERLIAEAELKVGSADDDEIVAGGPLVELVDQLILHGSEERATDIHIEPEEHVVRVRYRIDSILQPGPMIPKKLQAAISARLKVMAGLNISESRLPQDGRIRFEIKGRQIDLRISTFLCNFGENIVLRILDKSSVILTLENLGFLADDMAKFEKAIERPHGIILVTGPTGSGKTTTLYAALSRLNTVDVNIMTIEDPIEYELNLIRQSQVNTKAGITFASGLRALLRQDPDIILIGEMRDQETGQMAVRASMTGHLVFSTLHTNTATGAVPRLVDMGVEPLLVTDTVVMIIAQRLARRPCSKCREKVPAPKDRMADLQAAADREGIDWDGTMVVPKGCPACRFRGYQGRAALFEIFEMTDGAAQLILQKRWGLDLQHYVRANGMRSMYEDGIRRVLLGLMTLEEVERVVEREMRIEME